jgi:hypothetical protein
MPIKNTNARPRAQDAAASLSQIKNPQSAAEILTLRAGGIRRSNRARSNARGQHEPGAEGACIQGLPNVM